LFAPDVSVSGFLSLPCSGGDRLFYHHSRMVFNEYEGTIRIAEALDQYMVFE
jgi:hypothetical protein